MKEFWSKHKDWIIAIVMIAASVGFCLLGSVQMKYKALAEEQFSGRISLATSIGSCVAVVLFLIAIDILRRLYDAPVLRKWGSVLFCALPMAILFLLLYAGVPNLPGVISRVLFGLMMWDRLGLLVPLTIFGWAIYQNIPARTK